MHLEISLTEHRAVVSDTSCRGGEGGTGRRRRDREEKEERRTMKCMYYCSGEVDAHRMNSANIKNESR